MPSLPDLLLSTGALGTASFGIVEASKWLSLVGEAGFASAHARLGSLTATLSVAYGTDYETMLRSQYRGDQRELARTLRQGVRVGLTAANAAAVCSFLGSIDGARLSAAVARAQSGAELSVEERSLIGRYELAADARIDAALAVANADYAGTTRILASAVSLIIAVATQRALGDEAVSLTTAILVGIAAVPLAPIAKDLASALQSATKALKARL